LEEELLDRLDQLWLSFSEREREESEVLARAVDHEYSRSQNSTSFTFAAGRLVVKTGGVTRLRGYNTHFPSFGKKDVRLAPPVVGWCEQVLQSA